MQNFILIILLAAFPALSTDMYLPAIPTLCELWDISLAQANLSLASFFISFSVFLLIHGPLSDRYGRRPVLLVGVSLYVVGSLLCAAAGSITVLVLARVVQALGAAAASAMCLALAKDLYDGTARIRLLAWIGVIVPLCPMIAPTLGALLLQFFSWRGIFLCQALLALPALIASFRLREPLAERATGGVAQALARYRRLLANKGYMLYALAFSIVGLAFFAFIGGSSEIYIVRFGMNPDDFSLFFALNASGLMAGSFLCSRLCVGLDSRKVLVFSLAGMLAAALALLALGGVTPWIFALPMFAYTVFLGISRPIGNHLILEQVDRDTGTASSLFTFFIFLIGGVAMELISLDWPWPKPLVIAFMGVGGTLLPLVAVVAYHRRK